MRILFVISLIALVSCCAIDNAQERRTRFASWWTCTNQHPLEDCPSADAAQRRQPERVAGFR